MNRISTVQECDATMLNNEQMPETKKNEKCRMKKPEGET